MTKKTLVSAITAALVVGAASTTFAAANPFSDVPTDSWAYNAVVTLANDGVIDGFPNGTFQGNKNMTRYEMAQIIARAMAKENMSKADKATVQKLAAEFADELNNLGVKVANLEAKSDNVKLTGKVQYNYVNKNSKLPANQKNSSELLFRLDPTAYLGNGFTAHARLDAKLDAGKDQGSTDVTLDRAYVNGKLGVVDVTAGKLPVFLANGLVLDATLTGGQAVVAKDNLSVALVGGRTNVSDLQEKVLGIAPNSQISDIANIYGAQVGYTVNDNLSLNAGYAQLNRVQVAPNKQATGSVLFVGADAKVADNVRLSAEYAKAGKDLNHEALESKLKKAYSVQLDYKAADEKDAGSYGAYVAYRHLGVPALAPTYDGVGALEQGMEYGVQYVPAQNVVATAKYFNGRDLTSVKAVKVSKFYGNLEFLF